jgi:chemotaxis protein MotB
VNRRIELLVLTPEQSKAVSAMFGMPGNSHGLGGEVSTALPDANALQQLRNKLGPEGKYGTGRNNGN